MKLFESGNKKTRRFSGGIISVLLHIGVIAVVIFITAHKSSVVAGINHEEITSFVIMPAEKEEAPSRPPISPEPEQPEPTPKVVPTEDLKDIVSPTVVPDTTSSADPEKPTTITEDLRKITEPSTSVDSGEVVQTPPQSDLFFASEIDSPPEVLLNSPSPEYPIVLQRARLEGEVIAQFVVNEAGRAEMPTVRIIKSTHPLFEKAVRDAIPRMRFRPGRNKGKNVRTLVQVPFRFRVRN